jgi:hypothetical protein
MAMDYEIKFMEALALTVAVEAIVICMMIRLLPPLRRRSIPLLPMVAAGVIPSVATLPYLWFIAPAFIHPYGLQVGAGEVAIWAVETVMIRLLVNIPVRWCALLSFTANAASVLAGLAVFR